MVVEFEKRIINSYSFWPIIIPKKARNLLELIFWLWIPVNPLPNWRAAAAVHK